MLRQAGLTELKNSRLEHLRWRYAAEDQRHELASRRRLQFVRWLLATGKLTEQGS